MKNKSVKGLANIAQLLNRGDLAVAPAAPKRERRSCIDIETRTNEKIRAAIPLGANLDPKHWTLIDNFVRAAVRDSYNLGHADALDQNSQVERLLEKQYQKRTEVTMPAVVAGIMEQLGMSSMTLDLAHLATVFDRNQISYVFNDDTNVMEYTMRPAGVDA
jgi:hypothetical protein